MAVQKTAYVTRVEPLSDGAGLLYLAMPEGQPLGFCGGQYLIVDSGLPLPGGKVAKRAYSILSDDREQNGFQLAVKRIAGGPASNHLNDLPVGAPVRFSGPWGKFHPTLESPSERVWLLATDTGITAALGLLCSRRFEPYLPSTHLTWLSSADEHFFPESFVAARVPGSCGGFTHLRGPGVGDRERVRFAASLLAEHRSARSAFLSGDGDVIHSLLPRLLDGGMEEGRIRFECFFNNPARKAAAA